MNWETILVAVITSTATSIVALSPVYIKIRDDRRKEKQDAADTAKQAQAELIRQLTTRVEALEVDRDELEQKLDEERAKRRQAEAELAEALIEISRLKSKVEKLEKRDTGELK